MTGRLAGQVALITGGATGIGRGVVERFLTEGALVAALDRAPERLADVENDALLALAGDVRSLADNRAAVDATIEQFGHLDVFVGNAGIGDAFTPLVELDDDVLDQAFDELFAVNVKGYLLGAKATVDALIATRGSMIFTLSNASFYPDGGGPIYTASKHAGLGLVRQLAHELGPAVRVNGVAPGGTPSDLRLPSAFGVGADGQPRRAYDAPESATEVVGEHAGDIRGMIRQVTPAGVVAEPADHAGAYVLLASCADARVITGTVIETNGGLGVRGVRRVRGGDGLLA